MSVISRLGVTKAVNKNHIKMPASQRAKQFAPFDAVAGLRAALTECEKIRMPRKIVADDLSEEINRTLCGVAVGDTVTLLYYNSFEQNYVQLTGHVRKTDIKNRVLHVDEIIISLDDIYEIRIG